MSGSFLGGHDALAVVNVGLARFAAAIDRSGAGRSVAVDWRPPADGDPATAALLAALFDDPRVDEANDAAAREMLSARPELRGVQPAHAAITALAGGARALLHSGPPIAWHDMCGPMRGALAGAAQFEGWASSADDATSLLESGQVSFGPCHDAGAVGPMAGVISPSMPVWVVEDPATGHRTFSNLNEGLGRVLRFGAHDGEVLARLRWMRDELGPLLADVLADVGPIPLMPLLAQALHMGDELHNRNAAATGQLLKRLAPVIAARGSQQSAGRALEFIGSNDHFFLNISMATAKSMLERAAGFEHCSLVTAMARNGVRFGIRVSGTGTTWFEAPSPKVDGLYFPGYGPADAAGDLGDSAITETAGLGGFSMAGAPAIVQFVGGTAADALGHTRAMREITVAANAALTIPACDFAGVPTLIDLRRVLDTGIAPVINTGIAHRDAGVGQIGAGVTYAPAECFVGALRALAAATRISGRG